MRTISAKTKREVHLKVIQILEEYYREAEEHEDDDVIRDTTVEERLNDFAEWFHQVRKDK